MLFRINVAFLDERENEYPHFYVGYMLCHFLCSLVDSLFQILYISKLK